jgi:hypothetical protein
MSSFTRLDDDSIIASGPHPIPPVFLWRSAIFELAVFFSNLRKQTR